MTETAIAWPRKGRELHDHHFDSTMWNGFAFRDDDIVIATYAKSGTTWVQQMLPERGTTTAPSVAEYALRPPT